MDPDLATQILLGAVLQPVVSALYGHMPTPLVKHHGAIVETLRRALVNGEQPPAKRD